MHDPRIMDPGQEIIRHEEFDREELDRIVALLEAMRRWREAERRMHQAEREYMRLGETDMRALRFIIAAARRGSPATPSALAKHLRVSTASVTKMLDRLAEHGHIRRVPHPRDRRSVAIEVSPETAREARRAVGRRHAERFQVAAALTPAEREAVTRFFDALSATEDDAAR